MMSHPCTGRDACPRPLPSAGSLLPPCPASHARCPLVQLPLCAQKCENEEAETVTAMASLSVAVILGWSPLLLTQRGALSTKLSLEAGA